MRESAWMSRIAVHLRSAAGRPAVYAGREPAGLPVSTRTRGRRTVQTAQPRDVAALALVVGVFMVLFIVSVLLGSPAR